MNKSTSKSMLVTMTPFLFVEVFAYISQVGSVKYVRFFGQASLKI